MRRAMRAWVGWTALVATAAACNDRPHSNPKGNLDGGGDSGTEEGGVGDVDDTSPTLTLDRPAFYSDGSAVRVTGTVTDDGALDGVTVATGAASVAATIAADGHWQADVPLSSAPWAVVEATATDVSGNTQSLQAQIAAATEGTAPLVAGAETVAGPAGTATLAAWIAPFAQAAAYGPPAGVLVQDTCLPCPDFVECGHADVTETISTTGDWTLRFDATLATAGGRLDVDLSTVEVDWPLLVDQDNGEAIDNEFGGLLTGALTGASPAVGCQGLGLDTAFDADSHAWTLAADQSLYCFVQSDLEGPADALWTPVVPPALSGAVCDWAAWLEPALTTTVPGATLTYAATASTDGLRLTWDAVPDTPPDWQSLDPGSPVTPDGIDVAMLDPLLGAVLHQAVDAALPARASADGHAIELRRVSADTASLAHVDGVEGIALVSPVSYTITAADGCTETGNLVPAPVALVSGEATGAWAITLESVAVAGSDVADACGLADGRDAVLEGALREALGAVVVSWTPNRGLKEEGATLTWTSGAGGYVVALTDATPDTGSR